MSVRERVASAYTYSLPILHTITLIMLHYIYYFQCANFFIVTKYPL